jgi:hypothetical protein
MRKRSSLSERPTYVSDRLGFITEVESVYSAVRAAYLHNAVSS